MNILDNFKIIIFCLHTFGVRYPRSVKPARIRQSSDWIRILIQGSTAYKGRQTPKVWKQNRRRLKVFKILFQTFFNSFRSR